VASGGPRAPRGRPVRDVLLGILTRTALLVLWALVLWGSLLAVSLLVGVLEVGVGGALARLLPGGHPSLWSTLNAAAVLLALLAWGLAAAAAVAHWRDQRRGPPPPG
jgi:hypothetical protein